MQREEEYESVGYPIRLHLEFRTLTVGELGAFLIAYQAALRSSWDLAGKTVDIIALKRSDVRLNLASVSSQHSISIDATFAIQTLFVATAFFGPVKDWPSFTQLVFGYLGNALTHSASEKGQADQILIRGGRDPMLVMPAHILQDERASRTVEKLWDVAQSKNIDNTQISVPGTGEVIQLSARRGNRNRRR